MAKEYITVDPNDIYFSQKSAGKQFSDALGRKLLGVVLDEIIDGNMDFDVLTDKMKVSYYEGKRERLFTVNNRSLWVLRQLRLNNYQPVEEITVELRRDYFKQEEKSKKRGHFDTKNNGTKILIRGDPKGEHTLEASFWEIKGGSTNRPVHRLHAVGSESDEDKPFAMPFVARLAYTTMFYLMDQSLSFLRGREEESSEYDSDEEYE